jgi:hypothetical protein
MLRRSVEVLLAPLVVLIFGATAASTQTVTRATATVTANAPNYIGAAVSPTPLRGADPGTQAQEGEHRVLLVNVLDREGHHVPGLESANFRGEYRGQPVTIRSLTEDTAPRRVAVVVDVSASQQEATARNWLLTEQLIDTLVPRHTVALFTVAETLEKHANLTNDRDALQRALRGARSRRLTGPSSLYDGVVQAASDFPGVCLGDVVCLFSDGVDTSSSLSTGATVGRVTGKGYRVFLVASVPDRMTLYGRIDSAWQLITETTGGVMVMMGSFKKEDAGDMARITHAVHGAITSTYRLELWLPRAIDKPRDWELWVVDSAGRRLKDVRVVYPHRLAPLPTPIASTR